ncbi:MAG: TonB-dependent receptor [Candidatus Latescibacteria bacterium]|nr:TonB-dependent receptor [Candidatus Latescibacterota bacterium]
MRFFRLALMLGLAVAVPAAKAQVRGQVMELGSGRALPYATVQVLGTGAATFCDSDGFFSLELAPGSYSLEVSSIGHGTLRRWVTVGAGMGPLLIGLERRTLELTNPVMVYGVRAQTVGPTARRLQTTDVLLDQLEGVNMVRRANFALAPSIRGGQSGRVGLAIDGMKIFAACVDHMDPITSYVEAENLAQLEVAKGAFDLTQGQAISGTVNLVTQKATFARPFYGRTELGYESVSRHRYNRSVVNVAVANLALRGSFSYRRANDFRPGGRGAIDNTQFAKYNAKIDLSRRGEKHQIDLSVLGDTAWDIGYPALLMDATRAQSRLFSGEHTWTPSGGRLHWVRSRFYHSRVDHWMDDRRRDVSQRAVMRDMHMPMYGKTRTWGLLQRLLLAEADQSLELVVDFYQLGAFADMRMISTDAAVTPMYLLNLGAIQRRHLALAADYSRSLSKRLLGKINMRWDGARQDIHDPMGRRQLAAAWGNAALGRGYASLSLSAVLEYAWRPHTRFKLSLAQSARLPTHLENYGFFLFNPSDGFFYTGNPTLKSERSRQLEVGLEHEQGDRRLRIDLYYNRLAQYITGVVQEDIFKYYANIPAAYIYGGELSAVVPLPHQLQAAASASYTLGHNRTFAEPLPFIAPFERRLELSYRPGSHRLAVQTRWVSRQGRIAHLTTLEDRTPGFVVLGASARIALNAAVAVQLGVDNLLNRFYHEHLSVDNFPSPGRNITLALEASL